MRVLVTGGAGFIGSNFIHYALAQHTDWQILNLDKLTYAGNLENLRDVEDDPRYAFVRADVADAEAVEDVFRRFAPDWVVHFAAESHVDRSIMDAGPFVETNVKGTQVLLDAARRHPVQRFVQISTDEVYGSLPLPEPGGEGGRVDTAHRAGGACGADENAGDQDERGQADTGAFTEESPLKPNSPYAASKAAADLLARAYYHTYGLPVLITRCSNNYGPYQFPEKLIPLMITNAMEGRPLPVYGDGRNVRDWIHVEDHCRAIDLVLQKGRPGQVYNIGASSEMANLDVVRLVLKTLGKPESLITFVADRPGHDRRYAIDAGKIRRELGWTPQHRFAEALPALVRWYQENEAWWRRIKAGEYRSYYERMYRDRGVVRF